MKSWMYLALDLGSVLLPALFSFHPKIQFHKEFKGVFWGIATAAVLYISWDIYFTLQGVWGFNPEYLTGIQILSLPLEEWLFFICIPYACLFTMHVLSRTYLSRYSFSWTKNVFLLVAFFLVAIGVRDATQWYTITTFCLSGALSLVAHFVLSLNHRGQFLFGFLVILFPFFLVNGILTGTGLEHPVVWYNNQYNMSLRIGTIPVEDLTYAWGMLLTAFLVWKKLKQPEERFK